MLRRRRQTSSDSPGSILRNVVLPVLWALGLALVLRATVVEANFIPSGSMEPTLLVGDHLLTNKLAYGLKVPFTDQTLIPLGSPQRGEVVIFKNPTGKGPDFVKRIMGLPGETIQIEGKRIFINGQQIKDPWGRFKNQGPRTNFGPLTIPPGQYFMLGDNRDNSFDSRFWNQGRGGLVPLGDIRGRVMLVLWSWEEFPLSLRLKRSGTFINE